MILSSFRIKNHTALVKKYDMYWYPQIMLKILTKKSISLKKNTVMPNRLHDFDIKYLCA